MLWDQSKPENINNRPVLDSWNGFNLNIFYTLKENKSNNVLSVDFNVISGFSDTNSSSADRENAPTRTINILSKMLIFCFKNR